MPGAIDFTAPTVPLAFNQGSKVYMPIVYKAAGSLVDLTGYGARFSLRGGDDNAVQIALSVGAGIVIPTYPGPTSDNPNIIVTFVASVSQGIAAISGAYGFYLDPNGIEDDDSFAFWVGAWQMVVEVPA